METHEIASNSAHPKPVLKSVAPRVRSIAYPSYDINFCYELALKIHQTFGSTSFSTREEISEHLKISVSHLLTQLSSCVQYGLLDIKNKEGYKPTPLFTVLYKPFDEQERQKSLLECFSNPDIYQKLITQFNNQSLPSFAGLSTILIRSYKVSETGAPPAARVFLENVSNLRLADNENILRVEVPFDLDQPESNVVVEANKDNRKDKALQFFPSPTETKTINYVPENTNNANSGADNRIIPIYFKDGGEAQVILPNKFTNENLAKVVKVLTAYIDD